MDDIIFEHIRLDQTILGEITSLIVKNSGTLLGNMVKKSSQHQPKIKVSGGLILIKFFTVWK